MRKPSPRIQIFRLLVVLIIAGLIPAILRLAFPSAGETGIRAMKEYGLQILILLPAILVLMGLADVWVPTGEVKKHLGTEAGLKGMLLSLFLGTLPTGPLFIAFPIAGELLSKGARPANVIIFLGSWAALKIPEISMEIHFLGAKFAFLRFSLSFFAIILIGLMTERFSTIGQAHSTDQPF